MLNEATIKAGLAIPLPHLNKSLIELDAIQSIQVNDSHVHLKITFGFPIAMIEAELRQFIIERVNSIPGVQNVQLDLNWKVRAHAVNPSMKSLPQIKNIIAVASGKGGVGKSTTAANLALAMAAQGARVGMLDADIYGPNQPHMLGVSAKPILDEQKKMLPNMAHGIQTMSMGYLVDVETPMVWRGPMVSTALQQLFRDTVWDNLDYLFVDLPPGTGDIQLTLSTKIPVTGVVVVTTPQDIALLDARKGLEMFRKVNVALLGVIENMSVHTCSQCGHAEAIFGQHGAEVMAKTCDVPLLGHIPLALSIRESMDCGEPIVLAAPDSVIAKNYHDIALRLGLQLALQPLDYGVKFPSIVVE